MRLRGRSLTGNNIQELGINATGTTAASSLSASGVGGKFAVVSFGPIITDGAFRSIVMHKALLEGNLTAPLGLGNVDITYASSGAITSGAPIKPGRRLSINGTAWNDVSVNSAGPISTIHSKAGWSNSDTVSESIQAPDVRDIHSKGNFTPGLILSGVGAPGGRALGTVGIMGYIGGVWNFPSRLNSLSVGGTEPDFNGTFTTPLQTFNVKGNLSGSLTAPSIGTLHVGGLVSRATLTFTKPVAAHATDLAHLTVHGGIDGTTITSQGNIGALSPKPSPTARFTPASAPSPGAACCRCLPAIFRRRLQSRRFHWLRDIRMSDSSNP